MTDPTARSARQAPSVEELLTVIRGQNQACLDQPLPGQGS